MREQQYKRGRQLIVEGVRMLVRGRATDGALNLQETESGRFLTMAEADLADLWARRKLEFVSDDEGRTAGLRVVQDIDFAAQSKAAREFAECMQPYVVEFARRGMRFTSSEPALTELIAEVYPTAPNRRLQARKGTGKKRKAGAGAPRSEPVYGPPSWKALSRLLRRWDRLGRPDPADVRLFLPAFKARGDRKARFTTEQEEVIDRVIRSHILKRRRATAVEAADEVEALLRKENLLPPKEEYAGRPHFVSARTVERRVEVMSNFDKTLAWEGESAAGQLKPVMSVIAPRYPLEVVEFDFHRTDLIARAVWGPEAVGRPVVAAAIDVFSRCYAGFIPIIGPPSEILLLRLLKMCLLPKTELLERHPEIKSGWAVFGKMDAIRLDNALEHHAGSFRSACSALGIRLEWTEKKKPRQRPFIERSFGTFTRDFVHHLPATTYANVGERADMTPETDAKLSIEDLEKLFPWWACDLYHADFHSGVGMPPAEKYREGSITFTPPLPGSRDEVDRICSLRIYVPLTREGVTVEGLRFNSKDRRVFELLNAHDKPKNCLVLVDPDCLDNVLLSDWRVPPDDRSEQAYVPLKSLFPDLTDGVPLDLHRLHVIVARNKKKNWERVTADDLRAARDAISEFVRNRIKEGKAVSSRLQAAAAKAIADSDPVKASRKGTGKRNGRGAGRADADAADNGGAPGAETAAEGTPRVRQPVDQAALAAKFGFSVSDFED